MPVIRKKFEATETAIGLFKDYAIGLDEKTNTICLARLRATLFKGPIVDESWFINAANILSVELIGEEHKTSTTRTDTKSQVGRAVATGLAMSVVGLGVVGGVVGALTGKKITDEESYTFTRLRIITDDLKQPAYEFDLGNDLNKHWHAVILVLIDRVKKEREKAVSVINTSITSQKKDSVIDDVERLVKLFEKGVLTKSEFDAAKKDYLGVNIEPSGQDGCEAETIKENLKIENTLIRSRSKPKTIALDTKITEALGHPDVLAEMLREGLDPNFITWKNRKTPTPLIHRAALHAPDSKKAEILKLLIERGANPKVRWDGQTLWETLGYPVVSIEAEIVDVLESAGLKCPKVTKKSSERTNRLPKTVKQKVDPEKNLDVQKLIDSLRSPTALNELIESGVSANQKIERGTGEPMPLIHYVVCEIDDSKIRSQSLRVLIDRGADINICWYGRTVVDLLDNCRCEPDYALLNLLKLAGAKSSKI